MLTKAVRWIAAVLLFATLAGCETTPQTQGFYAFNEGLAREKRGDWNGAILAYQESINRGEAVDASWNNIGTIQQNRFNNKEAAIKYFSMAARHGSPVARQNLLNLGQPVPAADLAQQRVAVQPQPQPQPQQPQATSSNSEGAAALLYLLNSAVEGYNQGRASAPPPVYSPPPAYSPPQRIYTPPVRCTTRPIGLGGRNSGYTTECD